MTQDNPDDDIQRFLLNIFKENPVETGESPQYDAPIYERDDAPDDDDDDAPDEISQLVPVEP